MATTQDLIYRVTVNDAALDRLIVKTNELGRGFIGTGNALKPLDAQLRALGRRSVEVGRYMTRNFTMPLLLAAAGAAKLGYDFEKSMSRIGSLAGASQEEVHKLSKEVLDLASSTLTSGPQDLAKALYFIRSSGIDAAHAMEVLKEANMGAQIGLGDTQTVADAMTSAINAYGKANLSAAQAVDVLTATVTVGKAETDALAKSIGYVIPIAAQMEVKFKEVGGLVAAMTLQGLGASSAITGIRAVLTTFVKGQPQVKKALETLGYSIGGIQASIRKNGLAPTLNTLRKGIDAFDTSGGKLAKNTLAILKREGPAGAKAMLKLQSASGNTAATLMSELFPNVRALNAFLILTGKNANKTAASIGEVGHSAGITKRSFDEIRKQNWAQFTETFNKLRAQITKLGKDILPFFTLLLKVALKVFKVFTFDWAGPFKFMFKPIQHAIALLGVMLIVIGPILAVFGQLIRISSVYVLRRESDSAKAAAASAREVAALEGIQVATTQAAETAALTSAATIAGVDATTAAYAREALAIQGLSIAQARAAAVTAAATVERGVAAFGGGAVVRGAGGRFISPQSAEGVKAIESEAAAAAKSVGRIGLAFAGVRAGIGAATGAMASFLAIAWPFLAIEGAFELYKNWHQIGDAIYQSTENLQQFIRTKIPGGGGILGAVKGLGSFISKGIDKSVFPDWVKKATKYLLVGLPGELFKTGQADKLRNAMKGTADESKKAKDWIAQFAKILGISRAEAERLLGLTQGIGKGFAQAAANARSLFEEAMSRLTGDIQTAFDAKTTQMTDAFDRKTSAMLDTFDQKTDDTWGAMAQKFERHTAAMLQVFDRKTDDTWDSMAQKFDDKTEQMVKKMRVTVTALGKTFVIGPDQLTPAERELKALEKADALRQSRRDLLTGGQEAAQAIDIGDPYAYAQAQQKIEDARDEIKKQHLQGRADVERKAADKALTTGETAIRRARAKQEKIDERQYRDFRAKERQTIEDERTKTELADDRAYHKRRAVLRQRFEDDRTKLRSELVAMRNLEWRHLEDSLKNLQTQLEKRQITIGVFNTKLKELMPKFGVTAAQGAALIGRSFGQQMQESLANLSRVIARHAKYLGNKHKELAAQAEHAAKRVDAAWKQMADNIIKQVNRAIAAAKKLPSPDTYNYGPGSGGPGYGATGAGAAHGPAGPLGGSSTAYFGDVLTLLQKGTGKRLNANQYMKVIAFFNQWAHREGVPQDKDPFNVLGTTLKVGGSHATNKQGVQAYKSWRDGIKALVSELGQSNFRELLKAVMSGDPIGYIATHKKAQAELRLWSGGGYSGWSGLSSGPVPVGDIKAAAAAAKTIASGGIAAVAYGASLSPLAHSAQFHLGGEAAPYDCSAFVQAVFRRAGIQIGRDTLAQYAGGTKINKNQLLPGDLVFFYYPGIDTKDPGHVGIYIGNGMMVHDHGQSSGVDRSPVDWSKYRGARCYLKSHVHYAQGDRTPTASAPSAAPAAHAAKAAGARALQTAGGGQVVSSALASVTAGGKRFVLPGKHPGLLKPGNIDIAHRPIVPNPDGSFSTVDSMSIEVDGHEVLIPRVVNGRVVSEKAAIQNYLKTKQNLGTFTGPNTATAYAQALHRQQAAAVAKRQRTPIKGVPAWLQKQAHSTVRMIARKIVQQQKQAYGLAHGQHYTVAQRYAASIPELSSTLTAREKRRLGHAGVESYLTKLAMIASNPLQSGLVTTVPGHATDMPWQLGAGGITGTPTQNININIYESGNPKKTAVEVRNILQKHSARNAKSVRGRHPNEKVGLR